VAKNTPESRGTKIMQGWDRGRGGECACSISMLRQGILLTKGKREGYQRRQARGTRKHCRPSCEEKKRINIIP